MSFTGASPSNPEKPPLSACRLDKCSIHDCFFIAVAATHHACMLLLSRHQPFLARCCTGGRKYWGSKISAKVQHPKMEVVFSSKNGFYTSGTAIIFCHLHAPGRKNRLSGSGSRVIVRLFHRGSWYLTGPPIRHQEGRFSYCRHSGQGIPIWPYVFILSLHSDM